ncbi:hypothetical protein ENUP19_0265G0018 [Entamoeba nuttalli]|uniref:Palmitoyltransferase n=2 Tax=Entamoeba nuttalli TaxID=412467 RepID=K2HMD3_ENTNP|nr:DHHC zinc finger domain containing protein [Entamoeba nuttalli P19]EKE36965.1 DHHC zinc finger domain containing protein [Entamoeba nuttalli P19]|eukprot:XP_008860705.1 DHHC zinc finger domain containing protein [Entamoeba nuttalli P19]
MSSSLSRWYLSFLFQINNQLWFLLSWTVMVVCGATAVYYSYYYDLTFFKIILTINWPWLCICMVLLNATNPGFFPLREEYFEQNQDKKFKMYDVNLFGSDITAKYKVTYLPRTFCHKCKFSRPLRVHHCRKCDRCVERFDHHCSWIGNCVGSNNRKIFYTFLCITMFTDYIATITTGYSIYCNVIKYRIITTPLLYFSFCLFISVAFFITKLWYFHTQAICKNYTTYEYIKNKDFNLPNPYDEGIKTNIIKFFFTSNPSCGQLFWTKEYYN